MRSLVIRRCQRSRRDDMRRNRIIYLLFLIGATVLVSFVGGTIPYAFFYLVLLIPILSILYIVFVFLNLSFFQSTTKKIAVKEEILPYNVRLINPSFISFTHVKLNFYEAQCEVTNREMVRPQSLLPGEQIALNATITCKYRGEYPIGACDIEVSDFLFLFHKRWTVDWPLKILVLPRIVPLERLVFLPDLMDPKRTSMQQKQSDNRGSELRKYQGGDPIKAIHWKAVARQRELLTRKNEPSAKGENYIFLDLSPTGREEMEKLIIEDKLIEVALAIGNFLKEKGIPGDMYCGRGQLENYRLSEEGRFGAFYDACGKLTFDGISIYEGLEEMLYRRMLIGHFILITHRLEPACIDLLLEHGQRQQFILILIKDEKNCLGEEEKNLLLAHEIKLYEIETGDMIKESLEGRAV